MKMQSSIGTLHLYEHPPKKKINGLKKHNRNSQNREFFLHSIEVKLIFFNKKYCVNKNKS